MRASLTTLALLGSVALGASAARAAEIAVLTPYLASVTTGEMVKGVQGGGRGPPPQRERRRHARRHGARSPIASRTW